jgi:hypothetical protein
MRIQDPIEERRRSIIIQHTQNVSKREALENFRRRQRRNNPEREASRVRSLETHRQIDPERIREIQRQNIARRILFLTERQRERLQTPETESEPDV